MTLYIENPKDATRKLLEIMNEFSKVTGYKINTQKPLAFLYINKLKDKNHMINISRESLQQNSIFIYDKKYSPESRNRRNITQYNKGHILQPHSKYYPQCWKTESISFKTRNKSRVSTLTDTIQHSFGSPSYGNQRRTRNKMNPYRKRRSKTLTVCRWHYTMYRKP